MSEPGEFIIQIIDIGGVTLQSKYAARALSHVGRFIVDYDPTAVLASDGVETLLVTSEDPIEAKGFATMREAMDYTQRSIGVRPDGKPDRPLTAYTLGIERRWITVDEAEARLAAECVEQGCTCNPGPLITSATSEKGNAIHVNAAHYGTCPLVAAPGKVEVF